MRLSMSVEEEEGKEIFQMAKALITVDLLERFSAN